jgi:hypothetical protein
MSNAYGATGNSFDPGTPRSQAKRKLGSGEISLRTHPFSSRPNDCRFACTCTGDVDPLLNSKVDSTEPAAAPSEPMRGRRKAPESQQHLAAEDDLSKNEPWGIGDYCLTGCTAVFCTGLLGLFAWMTVVGLENDNTDCEKPLWIWLVTCGVYGGGVILFYTLGLIAYHYYEKR